MTWLSAVVSDVETDSSRRRITSSAFSTFFFLIPRGDVAAIQIQGDGFVHRSAASITLSMVSLIGMISPQTYWYQTQ